jgi:hypothetical protein
VHKDGAEFLVLLCRNGEDILDELPLSHDNSFL